MALLCDGIDMMTVYRLVLPGTGLEYKFAAESEPVRPEAGVFLSPPGQEGWLWGRQEARDKWKELVTAGYVVFSIQDNIG